MVEDARLPCGEGGGRRLGSRSRSGARVAAAGAAIAVGAASAAIESE